MHLYTIIIVLCLDLLIGDPYWLPHPIRWIGALIQKMEQLLFPKSRSKRGEQIAGIVLGVGVIGITAGITFLLLFISSNVSSFLRIVCEIGIGFYCLSARSLAAESQRVLGALRNKDLEEARKRLSMIVGRDTENLKEDEICRATIETIGENIVDGIISPLFYFFLGGPIAALAFKAVSTMDSMIGHINGRYRYFGSFAARLDDILNFIPARITSFVLIPLAASITGLRGVASLKITARDRLKHPSPNSAHGEAALAGALGIQLGGTSTYKGVVSEKPLLGDPIRNITTDDISKAIRLIFVVTTLWTMVILCCQELLGIKHIPFSFFLDVK